MNNLLSNFDVIVDQLRHEDKVSQMSINESAQIIQNTKAQMEPFLIEKLKKEQDSFVEGQKVRLNA